MITFIAFLLTMLGSINWLMIGLLQYDFIAGLFGWQSSMLSRLTYILFGVAAAYLLVRVIVNKGSFKVWERKKNKKPQNPLPEASVTQSETIAQTPQPMETIKEEKVTTEIKPKKKKKFWQIFKKKEKSQNFDEKTAQKGKKTEFFDKNEENQDFSDLQKNEEKFSNQDDFGENLNDDFGENSSSEDSFEDSLFDEHLEEK